MSILKTFSLHVFGVKGLGTNDKKVVRSGVFVSKGRRPKGQVKGRTTMGLGKRRRRRCHLQNRKHKFVSGSPKSLRNRWGHQSKHVRTLKKDLGSGNWEGY